MSDRPIVPPDGLPSSTSLSEADLEAWRRNLPIEAAKPCRCKPGQTCEPCAARQRLRALPQEDSGVRRIPW